MNEAAALAKALAQLEPAMRLAFLNAIQKIRSVVQVAAVISYLQDGNVEAAINAASITGNYFFAMDQAFRESYNTGGKIGLLKVEKTMSPFSGESIKMGFDGSHPRAETYVRQEAAKLITSLTSSQEQVARTVILDGLEKNKTGAEIAKSLVGSFRPGSTTRQGGFIGITDQQARFAINMEEELSSGNLRAYFDRTRRDKRYDKLVYSAIKSGKPLDPAKIEEIVGRYKDRLLDLRGQTIARTEVLTAMGAGRHEGYIQLVDSGAVRDDHVIRIWDATMDSRTRPDHWMMHGQEVQGMTGVFTTPAGRHPSEKLMFPRDTSLGASGREVINCRCFETIRIDYL